MIKLDPGDKAVQFINLLQHVHGKWARQTFDLREWQKEIIRKLFGTIDPDGYRQYRECGVWLPRKNGKSELAAAIALYLLLCEPEPMGQIYSAAAERDQAALVFNTAAAMVRADPRLESRVTIIDSRKRILNPRTGTFYQAISADARSKHGYNASAVIYDEVHCARNRDLYTALSTSFGARSQPLLLTITTAGLYDKTSLEWELFEYAGKVRDGTIDDPKYLPVIYAADLEEDWLDEAVWHRVNPALGDFRNIDEIRSLAKRAQDVPALENDFRRLYLNQHTAQTTRWLSMEHWERAKRETLPIHAGQECWAGLDLSTKVDLTALVLVFRTETGYAIRPYLWIPEDTAVVREKEDRVPYTTWHRQGFVEFTPGNRIDQEHIVKRVVEISEEHAIQQIAVDPWNAESVMQSLMAEGLDVLEMRQGHRTMNEPSRELEACLADGKIVHEGNACMSWMASNVEVNRNAGGHIRPVKSSEINRVDGITALVMGMSRAMNSEEVAEPQVFF